MYCKLNMFFEGRVKCGSYGCCRYIICKSICFIWSLSCACIVVFCEVEVLPHILCDLCEHAYAVIVEITEPLYNKL